MTRITQKEKVLRYLMDRAGRETTPLDVVRNTGLSVNAAYNTLSELSLDKYSRVQRIETGVYVYPPATQVLGEALEGTPEVPLPGPDPREPVLITRYLMDRGRLVIIDSSGAWRTFIEDLS